MFDPGKIAKLYYRRALASEGMGRTAQTVGVTRKTMRLDPKDTNIKAELKGASCRRRAWRRHKRR